jgi:iron complex transport system substrate-binding protein
MPFALSGETRRQPSAAAAPATPGRVVVLDLNVLDTIDALGITDVKLAAPKQALPPYLAKYKSAAVEDAGGIRDPNLERIYEFQPDLIFISGRQTDYYEKLSAIAPTILSTIDFKDYRAGFKRCVLTVGDAFKARGQAEALADALLARADLVAEKAVAGGKAGLVVMVNDGAVSAYGPGSRFGVIHDVFGVRPADAGIQASLHGQSVDFEYISRIDPDILFVINRNVAIGRNAVTTVLDNELVSNTRAGRNGKIVHLDSAVWYLSGSGLKSFEIMLGEIDGALD